MNGKSALLTSFPYWDPTQFDLKEGLCDQPIIERHCCGNSIELGIEVLDRSAGQLSAAKVGRELWTERPRETLRLLRTETQCGRDESFDY